MKEINLKKKRIVHVNIIGVIMLIFNRKSLKSRVKITQKYQQEQLQSKQHKVNLEPIIISALRMSRDGLKIAVWAKAI